MRKLALGPGAADVIDAGGRGAPDFRQGVVVEGMALARRGAGDVGVHGPNLPAACLVTYFPSPLWGGINHARA